MSCWHFGCIDATPLTPASSDGPQQTTTRTRHFRPASPGFCSPRCEGPQKFRARSCRNQRGSGWGREKWEHPSRAHVEGTPLLPRRRRSSTKEKPQIAQTYQAPPIHRSRVRPDPARWPFQGEESGVLEAVGERVAVGDGSLQDQWCPPTEGEPSICHCYFDEGWSGRLRGGCLTTAYQHHGLIGAVGRPQDQRYILCQSCREGCSFCRGRVLRGGQAQAKGAFPGIQIS